MPHSVCLHSAGGRLELIRYHHFCRQEKKWSTEIMRQCSILLEDEPGGLQSVAVVDELGKWWRHCYVHYITDILLVAKHDTSQDSCVLSKPFFSSFAMQVLLRVQND